MSLVRVTMLSTVLAAAIASSAAGQSLQELFVQGNAAYFEGDFATAIARYEALIQAGVDDADVHYNLGTAYARAGKCGAAIVELERSLRVSGGDDDAAANLQACQAQLGKRRAQAEGEATVQTRPPWSEALLQPVSLDTLAWVVLALNVALFTTLLLRRRARQETTRVSLAIAASLIGLGLLVAGMGLGVKARWFDRGEAAVVLREQAPLREGPDPRARSRSEAHEGERGQILQREGEYMRVRLARGPEGWMHADDVGSI